MRRDAGGFIIIIILCFLYLLVALPSTSSLPCHPDQRHALLRFKQSLYITGPIVASWRKDENCCSWDGITCDNSTGDVIGLNLTGAGLLGILPIEISQLSKLVSLDLSNNSGLEMQDHHTMRMLVSNLTQLEELDLGSVDMSTVTPTSFMNLSSSLISLKLSGCSLGGKFPEFIFGLPNLQVIDTSWNYQLTGTLPKSKWSPSLDYLSLSGCSFSGAVPNSIGNLSRLTYLDLSENNLTGAVPNSIGNLLRLTFLDLRGDNFTGEFDLGILSTLEDLQFLYLFGLSVSGEDANHGFSLPKLQDLDMESCNLSKFPSFLSRSKELRILHLSRNKIKEIPSWLWSIGIDTLEELYLDDNLIKGSIPPSICQQTSLSTLLLSQNKLTGVIPRCLCNLTELQELDLSNNSLTGPLPSSLPNCTSLMDLDVSYNMLEGPLPMPPAFIQGFQVWNNRFSGSIPPSIGRLTSLFILDMSQNDFTGAIPQCLGNHSELEVLSLSNNSLSGPLPSSLLNCTSFLSFLDVSYNMLEGPLPMPPAFIQGFQVRNNRFSGSIPPSICRLTSLFILDMSQNDFTGAIPQCLGNLTELWKLNLSNNSLSGSLPMSLANWTSLSFLDVSYNNISGAPPTWLSTTFIYDLNLRANNFGGQWPQDIFLRSAFLDFIDLSDNKFEGPLPLPSYSTSSYSVSNNHFSGKMSSVICNATNLQVLDLSNNSLTGALPDCLENVTGDLLYLNLRANEFHGKIPDIFHEASWLKLIDLSRNQFEGPLPRSLSHCKNLECLDVGTNKIIDSFPNWLRGLPLMVISLRSNHFFGHVNIAGGTHPFSMARIVDLSRNNFEGNLQDEFISEMFGMTRGYNYYFGDQYMGLNDDYYSVMIDLKGIEMEMVKINVQFAMLDLSSNQFHGEIPKSIGLLKSLKGLNFSHNRFTGSIPPSVGNLTNLEALDLSSNHLIGEIPKELVKLTSLGFLDLSWNNFTGPIPSGGHIDTFPNSSFKGNLGLCGIPLTRSCDQGNKKAQPSSEGKDDGKEEGGGWMVWEYATLGFGSGMGMGISLGYMVLEMGRPLWLVRMVIQLEAGSWKRSKRKGAPGRNV